MKRAWGGVVAIALVLPVLGFFALRSRARVAGERYLAMAIELDRRTYTRTVHHPLTGSASGLRLRSALSGHVAAAGWDEACTKVARGDEPLESLPEPCETAWRADREWVLGVMMAGRSDAWSRLPESENLKPLVHAGRVAALEIRKRPADEGAELCVDVLAVARDRGLGGGLIGVMLASSLVELVKQPCAAALASASDEKRAWAKQELLHIAEAWPPAGDWVPYEALGLIGAFHHVMTDDQLARLPAIVPGSNIDLEGDFLQRLVLMQAFPASLAFFERVEQAAKLEPRQRDVEVAALEAAEAESWNPIRRVGTPDYVKFFARADAARAALLKLSAP